MKKISTVIGSCLSPEESHSVFASLRQSFMFLMPIFMIGAFALSLEYFPITAVREFIEYEFNGRIKQVLDLLYNATYGFAAIYLVMVLSYYESQRKQLHKDIRVFAILCSVACYFGFMGPDVYTQKADFLVYTRMANIFSALLVGFGFTHLFFFFYKLFYKRHIHESTTAFERGIRAVIPFLCCLTVSVTASLLINLLPGICNFNDLIIKLLNRPYESMGASFFGGFSIMLIISVLWLFGIHGSNVFDSLLSSPSGPFAVGNGQIVSKPFIDTFVVMGGCGTSVCLLLALIIFGKSRKNRNLGHLSLIPVMFNINETLIFGLPIVLNPIYAVPFIVTPLISYTIAYFATVSGLVPAIINTGVQWTTPPIISGYQATGSIKGSILQIIILIIGTAIYTPFVRLAEHTEKQNTARNTEKLIKICKDCEASRSDYLLTGENVTLMTLESDIASKLNRDIIGENIILHYQPLVKDGKIFASEALLRFSVNEDASDKNAEYLYPPLVIGIANNYGLFNSLSKAIVKRALTDLAEIQKTNDPNFHIAVNLRLDLLADEPFRHWLIDIIEEYGITPHTFGVEINENANLSDTDNVSVYFDELKQAGIEVLMDDFSMGNTSITILQKNYFDYVKIDGNLIKRLNNERCMSIVSSIVQLGTQLNFSVIAEYVETENQRKKLSEIGCDIFQGYLYYKAMPCSQLKELLQNQS